MIPDVTVRNEGTIFIFMPHTRRASLWIEENIGEDAIYFGGNLVVEHRYARDLADGMMRDGLEVE